MIKKHDEHHTQEADYIARPLEISVFRCAATVKRWKLVLASLPVTYFEDKCRYVVGFSEALI